MGMELKFFFALGLMNMGERNHRKYSITSIAAAAVAPIIGVYNANPQVTSTPGNDAMTARKKSTDESMNKVHNLPQLKLNSDKGQQGKPGITLTSTTSSNKGPPNIPTVTSHSHGFEEPTTNNNNVNMKYSTISNPNMNAPSAKKAYGITAAQLKGVQNWWKSQMEYVSSDEE